MFTADTMIDTIQTGKKQFVSAVFAKNETVAKALNEFVDAQTAYTKSAVKAGTDVVAKLGTEATKALESAAKYDYSKAWDQFAKTYSVKK